METPITVFVSFSSSSITWVPHVYITAKASYMNGDQPILGKGFQMCHLYVGYMYKKLRKLDVSSGELL